MIPYRKVIVREHQTFDQRLIPQLFITGNIFAVMNKNLKNHE